MADEEKSIQDELSIPILLADRLIKSAHEAESSKSDCSNLAKQADCLSQKLGSVLRQISSLSTTPHSLYRRPLRRIFTDVGKNLYCALDLVLKCKDSGVLRQVFATNTTTTDDFRKVSALLESSIADVTWLLSIYENSDGGSVATLSVPPIASNDPILAMLWSSIASVQMGQLRDQIDAVNKLASLARDNDRNKKMIVEEGGVVPLLKLLKEGASDEAQIAAAAALWNLEMPKIVEVLADSSMKGQVELSNLVVQRNPMVQEFGRSTDTVLDDPTHKLQPDMASSVFSRMSSVFSRMSSGLKMVVSSCCSRRITRTIEADFCETIEKAMPGVARIRVKGDIVVDGVLQPFAGYATAFCFSPGLIATNCHAVCSKDLSGNFKLYDVCVDAVNQIPVPPTSVKPLAVNTGTDLAICRLPDDNNLPLIPLELGVGSRCRVGQQIFAIGHANTGFFGTQISRISHPSRRYNEVEIFVPNSAKVPSDLCYIQTGLGTRFGMSGSPVMSTSGQVIGIHSSGTLSQPKVSHEIYTDYLLELISWHLMNKKGSVFVHGDGVEGKSMG